MTNQRDIPSRKDDDVGAPAPPLPESRSSPIWTARPGQEARIDQVRATVAEAVPQADFNLWTLTKKVEFSALSGTPSFVHHVYTLDAENFDLILSAAFEIQHDDDSGVVRHLASAILSEVPVYPASPADEPALVALYERLLTEGFESDLEGKPARFKLTEKLAIDPQGNDVVKYLTSRRMLSPVEIVLLRSRISSRLAELEAAGDTLHRLDSAIAALRHVLGVDVRNEHDLQRILTANPILFGPEYRRVLPKHRLGAEYEMDYALERHSGFVDLVEIEASTHVLYNAKGDPRTELVHAEQQVLDWIEWMQAHGEYARSGLPQIDRPRGYVVIGRRASLDDIAARKLRLRNRVHHDTLEVLTYDDLLDRAIHLRDLITSASRPA